MQEKIEKYLASKFDPEWQAYQGPQRDLFALEAYNLSHDETLVNKIFPGLYFDPDSKSYKGTWQQQLQYLRACWNQDQVDEVIAASFKRIKEGPVGGNHYNPKHDAGTIATLSRCQFNTIEPQEPGSLAGAGYNPEAGYEDGGENGSSD